MYAKWGIDLLSENLYFEEIIILMIEGPGNFDVCKAFYIFAQTKPGWLRPSHHCSPPHIPVLITVAHFWL
jgi:hypothetical protein